MTTETGKIIKNLVPSEPVLVTAIMDLGAMISVSYTGVTSSISSNKIISRSEFDALEVVTSHGQFNFSGDPIRFGLFAEAERISSAYQFDPLFAVNCSIVDPLPHQIEAVYKFLLPLPKIRFLLADDTGAGKTIMTGLLLKELMMRGLIERVLIITPGGLTKQWQEDELGIKFNLPFTLVNRALFSSDPNIFHSAPRIVTSIDFISREDVLTAAGNSHWDLIVFDESHKLSAYEYGSKVYKSQRYEAAYKLSQQCEHLLLLTATPHRGRMDTFKMLLQLLDEDIFATEDIANARIQELEHDGINKFFIRRLKEDMRDWTGKPLFKDRFTKTTSYELTPEEKRLYDSVTDYLTAKKAEASQSKNIHVSLALSVMQRRLVSSIFAIRNTLERRFNALQGIVDELAKNPTLWQQKQKLESFDVEDIDDYDELEDDEREALDGILSDPRKFKLFTTSKSIEEIRSEANEVKKLFLMAEGLYTRQQEEQKFIKLRDLLTNQNVIDGEKLVLFTEHKDTLLYLEDRLRNNGYTIATIHGGKSVDERRQAQWDFAKPETQILIATDAAGEGINLQFCRLMINWDIPWNPNRLEQRMGRIHRYGQKQDVLVFNMVASNTKEGQVLERLLSKLDIIRESLGDDRVYDVIQDVLEDVSLGDIIKSVFNGEESSLDDFLAQDNEALKLRFSEKIQAHRDKLSHSAVDYRGARDLKEDSDEKRLQPIYVRLFFERAFQLLGGEFTEIREAIYRIETLPDTVAEALRKEHNVYVDAIRNVQFCFDKQVFLDYQNAPDLGIVHYINPGNPLFDSIVQVIRRTCREDMLKGTILISPDDADAFLAFFVKSQIVDNRSSKQNESVADERLVLINKTPDGNFQITSPAKLIDLHPPTEFAKLLDPPDTVDSDEVVRWSFENITVDQLTHTQETVTSDIHKRKEYLETGFTHVITDLQAKTGELQAKVLLGDAAVQEKIIKNQTRITELIHRKARRLEDLDLMTQVAPKVPEVLGCAYVVPLTQVEYEGHYGMSRDDEAEAIAMKAAMDYEVSVGWKPEDVSANNEGFDIRSTSPDELKRYIEVKGRSAEGGVMLSENEMNRLAQLGDSAWLYIVINCKTDPGLHRIHNPAKNLRFEEKPKGLQYFLPMAEWRSKV
jgi:superfamily II DNA or RNA helicase